MTIKQKIKKFFTIPEEDLKEECTKTFERVPLFKLTRTNLFLGLLFFIVIVNTLVGFDLNFLYLRQILGFLFLILVPGLLIMLCFKIRSVGFWEYLVYTIGLSVAFIMFAGLAVNWTLPLLNITDKPLSLYPILICFNVFLIVLGVIAWKRNKDLKHEFTTPKLDALNNTFFIIPMLFPVLSILGAFLLNNHGPNFLTMIMLGSIAVYVLLLVIFRKRLNENIWPWALWMIGLSLLLSGWMRSWYVSGVDTNIEYYIFQLIKTGGYWSISEFSHEYNSCLSVNILPSILSLFIQINEPYIFKLIVPIIFSIISIIIYLSLNNNINKIFSFISTFFFMSQLTFMGGTSIPIRQEIAFIFFGLMLLIFFTKDITFLSKKLLSISFGFSMIVSHYSTAYIAIALFLFAYLMNILIKKRTISPNMYHLNKEDNSPTRIISKDKNYFLSFLLIILLLFFTFFWYSQLNSATDNIFNFSKETIQNLGNIFTEEVREEDITFGSQLNIFYKSENPMQTLQNYSRELTLKFNNNPDLELYSPSKYETYKLKVTYSEFLSKDINKIILSSIYLLGEIIKKLMKIFIILGMVYLLFFQLNDKKMNRKYVLLSTGGLLLILIIMVLPYASINYDLDRLYQQALILLGLPLVFGGIFIIKFIKKKNKMIIFFSIFLLYFLFMSGFIGQLIGGTDSSMKLNNFGRGYDEFYVHKTEINSVNWFVDNYNNKSLVYADRRAIYRMWLEERVIKQKVMRNILPSLIDTYSYVYSSYTNVIKETSFIDYKKGRISYNFPTEFINDNKNKIYNEGESEIFK